MASDYCLICTTEDFEQGPIKIGDDICCRDCLQQVFQRAVDHEHSYPASWGPRTLLLSMYRHALPTQLAQAYEIKAKEYRCPADKRVYCSSPDNAADTDIDNRCNTFLGRRTAPQASLLPANAAVKITKQCPECTTWSCLACGSTTEVNGADHKCEIKPTEPRSTAFDGLQRGKHYQLCPDRFCGKKIELRDGCNAVTCTCRTEFCFICGQHAEHDSDHWVSQSGCPRFLQKDDPRALYEVGQGAPQMTTAVTQTGVGEMELNPAFLPPLELIMERVVRANEERTRREGHGRAT